MPSVTTWTRLEPRPRTNLQQRTLEARVHDPLWMLARQWQFGELNGEDAGSPIAAKLLGSYSVVQRYHPGPLPVQDFKTVQKYSGEAPLESLVERERVHATATVEENFRTSYEAGLHFLRVLGRDLSAKYKAAYLAEYPFAPLSAADLEQLDEESADRMTLIGPRAINGRDLFAALDAALRPQGGNGKLPAAPAIDAADAGAIQSAAEQWLQWHDSAIDEPGGENPSWQKERLEYAFALSGDSASGEVVLTASEYSEGHLDWSSFDVAPGATLHAPGELTSIVNQPVTSLTIPAPVRYKGMPVDRWWEFEDSRVNFGHVDAGPADLARMLMIEFAVIYGNDWFVIPVELPVGSLFRTSSLVITDTFGVRTLTQPNIQKQQPGQSWRMFELTGSNAQSNLFFLPPALMNSIHSEPVEDVLFLRDEMANLAWAIERIVESPAGERLDRIVEYRRRREAQRQLLQASQPLPEEPDQTLVYRLSSEVPEPWVPLVPQQISQVSGQIRLRRGALLMADGSHKIAVSQGRILEGNQLSLQEEEVPRSGVRVTRAWQHARWHDGSTHLWVGRTKQAGRGEGSSGLKFDHVEQKKA